MKPVAEKLPVAFAVEEAVAAGIVEAMFVTGRSQRAIKAWSDRIRFAADTIGGSLPPERDLVRGSARTYPVAFE